MKPFLLIVAGGRSLNNYAEVKKRVLGHMEQIINSGQEIHLIHGDAAGADRLGGQLAREMGWKEIPMPADWQRHGKSAGFKRNIEMANLGHALVAFWNGESAGTKHMIDTCRLLGLQVKIEMYRDIVVEQ